jgi:hypothetical protein
MCPPSFKFFLYYALLKQVIGRGEFGFNFFVVKVLGLPTNYLTSNCPLYPIVVPTGENEPMALAESFSSSSCCTRPEHCRASVEP